MEPLSQILETALYVDDLEKAERFYREILGLTLLSRRERRHSFFRLDGAMFLLFDPTASEVDNGEFNVPAHGAYGPGHVAFRVSGDELDGWKQHLEQHDVEIEQDLHWPDGGRSVYFRDPSGNSIELASPEVWE